MAQPVPGFGGDHPGTCPVTGLPLLRRPEWTNVAFGGSYRARILVVGDVALLSRPTGYITLDDVRNALELVDRIAAQGVGPGQPFVLIEDFSELAGASLEARRYYIERMKRHELIRGLLFYGASPLMQLSIKLGKRLNVVPYRIWLVGDYPRAVALAQRLMSADEATLPVRTPSAAVPALPRSIAGLPVRSDPEWSFAQGSFRTRLEVLQGRILHSVSAGVLDEKHVPGIASLRERVRAATCGEDGFAAIVANIDGLEGGTRRARRRYLESMRSWHDCYPFRFMVFYGVNRTMRAAINLGRAFVPFKVRIADNIEGAVAIAREVMASTAEDHRSRVGDTAEPAAGDHPVQRHVDELLRFLGGIDWERDGVAPEWQADSDHPFSPVFDAIGLLKGELDDLHRERRLAEEKRVDLERRLQRAEKMEALGTLAGGVAHDLNNLLSALVTYPELMLLRMEPDNPLREQLEKVKRSGEKAAAIVNDLLFLARRSISTAEVVDLNQVVSEYLDSPEHRRLVQQHPAVQVDVRLEEDLASMVGSPVHLSKTLMNLVRNAAEAMPDGGDLRVETSTRHVSEPLPAIAGRDIANGRYVVLRVSDTGVGIAPSDLGRIFEPFYTRKIMGRSGTGLGMAVVWGTVTDHQGSIDVQSTVGEGSTFELYFPVTSRKPEREGLRSSISSFMGRGETILLVDDMEEQRDIGAELLRCLGYAVTAVGSGEEAVAHVSERPVDLVILDMILDPGMDGLETYRRILEVRQGQRAVIASGYSENERVKEAQRLGAGGFVRKPYLLEEIGRAIRAELDR